MHSGKTAAFLVAQSSIDTLLLENVERIRSGHFEGCYVSNGKKDGGSCHFQDSRKDARCECETLTEHGLVLLLWLSVGLQYSQVLCRVVMDLFCVDNR
jgi:hypothetical protein